MSAKDDLHIGINVLNKRIDILEKEIKNHDFNDFDINTIKLIRFKLKELIKENN